MYVVYMAVINRVLFWNIKKNNPSHFKWRWLIISFYYVLYENEFDIQQSMADSAFEAIDFFVYLKKYHFVVWRQQLWKISLRRIGMALMYLTNTLWKSSITLDIKIRWYQTLHNMSGTSESFHDFEPWTTMLSKAFLKSMKLIVTGRSHAATFFRIRRRVKIWSLHNLPHLTPACLR